MKFGSPSLVSVEVMCWRNSDLLGKKHDIPLEDNLFYKLLIVLKTFVMRLQLHKLSLEFYTKIMIFVMRTNRKIPLRETICFSNIDTLQLIINLVIFGKPYFLFILVFYMKRFNYIILEASRSNISSYLSLNVSYLFPVILSDFGKSKYWLCICLKLVETVELIKLFD